MPLTSLWVGDLITLSPSAGKEIQCAVMVSQTKRINFTFDREKGITAIDLNVTDGIPENITSFMSPSEYSEFIAIELTALQRIAQAAFRCGQVYGELLAG